MFGNEDHFTEHIATPAEADREYVSIVGAENPQKAWILSDRDVWYPNPCYSGPAVPHPEEAAYLADLAEEGR